MTNMVNAASDWGNTDDETAYDLYAALREDVLSGIQSEDLEALRLKVAQHPHAKKIMAAVEMDLQLALGEVEIE